MSHTCFICGNVINRKCRGSRWFRPPRTVRNRSRRRRPLCPDCALLSTPDISVGHHHDRRVIDDKRHAPKRDGAR